MKTVTVGLCCLMTISLSGCEDAQVSDSAKVQRFSEINLNGPMPRAYRDFVNQVDPYGALYVTETGGGGGRIGGQASLEAAKSAALAHCTELNPDANCVLFATKVP